jgi:hypothetical protein
MTYDSTISSTDNFKNLSENLNKNIKIFCKNIDEKNIRINKKYDFDECFVKTENEGYIKVLGKKERDIKVTRPNRNIKPFVHADSKIKVLWDIDKINEIDFSKKIFGCFIKTTVVANTKQLWLEMYNNIMSDTLENISKYSSWISINKQHYKNSTGLFKDQDIKHLWETIKNDEIKGLKFYSKEEIWFMKLEDYKNYYLTPECKIDKESLMSSTKYNRMHGWIDRNVKNYRNNKSLMLNLEIKQEWESFMYDSKYYDIFKYHNYTSQYKIDQWKNYLKLVINSSKILKETNLVGKNRSDINLTEEEKNSFWLINSKNNWIEENNTLFESKKKIMESEEIYKLWDNFLLENKKIITESNKENEEKKSDNERKSLQDLDDFKKKIDSIEERTITTFSTSEFNYMNRMHINVSVNKQNFKFIIDKWLKLINDDNYKKFDLKQSDNFYFYLNYFKKIFDDKTMFKKIFVEKTILTEEIRIIFYSWRSECNRNYRLKFSEMSLENKDIRKDYRDFKSQYNL